MERIKVKSLPYMVRSSFRGDHRFGWPVQSGYLNQFYILVVLVRVWSNVNQPF
jgi:hypothetical protein